MLILSPASAPLVIGSCETEVYATVSPWKGLAGDGVISIKQDLGGNRMMLAQCGDHVVSAVVYWLWLIKFLSNLRLQRYCGSLNWWRSNRIEVESVLISMVCFTRVVSSLTMLSCLNC